MNLNKKTTNQEAYLRALYNEGEYVCLAKNQYGIKGYRLDFSRLPITFAQFIGLNPLIKGTTRKAKNAAVFRNLLVEYDLALGTAETQLEYINKIGLPYTTAVFSGGKSVHFIISLVEPLESRALYDKLFWRLQQFEPKLDIMCKDPLRLTRLGGALRQSGKLQSILQVNERVYLADLEKYLDSRGIPSEKPSPKKQSYHTYSDSKFIHPKDRAILEGKEVLAEGERYQKLRGIIARLVHFEIDNTPDEVYNRIQQARELCGFIGQEEDKIIMKSIEGAFEKFK